MNRINFHLGVALLSLGLLSASATQAFAQEAPAVPGDKNSSNTQVPEIAPPTAPAPTAPQSATERSRAALNSPANVLDENNARLEQLEARGSGGGGGEVSADDIDELREEIEETSARIDEAEESLTDQMEKKMVFTGYTTSYFEKTQNSKSRFRAFRINLLFNHYITKTIRFFAEIEFEDPAAIGDGKGVVEGEAGFVEFMPSPKIGIRTGIFLMPFGYYNLLHEGWRYAFRSRPLVNESIFPSTYADVGVMLQGSPYRSESLALHYQVAMTNGFDSSGLYFRKADGNRSAGKGLRGLRPGFKKDNNNSKGITGRLSANIGEHLEVGASGLRHVIDMIGHQILIGGLDAEFTSKNFVARAEGIYSSVDSLTNVIDGTTEYAPTELSGAVFEAEQRFFPSALKDTFIGAFEDPKFFVAARVDVARIVDPKFTQKEAIVTGSIGFRPVYRSAFRLEFLQGYGDIGLGDNWRFLTSVSLGY